MKRVATTIIILNSIIFASRIWASQIAFISLETPDTEVCIINSDGTNLTNLTKSPQITNRWPTWSPDGKKIAFVTSVPSQLYLMEADGSNITLLKDGYNSGSRPTWSPNGRKIAFGGVNSIFILDVDTKQEERLFIPIDQCEDAAWSPDGSRIAFTARVAEDWLNHEIYLVNANGNALRRLTKSAARDSAPAWSPDGQRIAFFSDRDNKAGIYVMDTDGGNIQRITEGGENFPSWSPSGDQIAFSISGDPPQVGVMRIDGRQKKFLAEGSTPAWQPTVFAVDSSDKLISTWGRMKQGF